MMVVVGLESRSRDLERGKRDEVFRPCRRGRNVTWDPSSGGGGGGRDGIGRGVAREDDR
jgi:hypothetical protein